MKVVGIVGSSTCDNSNYSNQLLFPENFKPNINILYSLIKSNLTDSFIQVYISKSVNGCSLFTINNSKFYYEEKDEYYCSNYMNYYLCYYSNINLNTNNITDELSVKAFKSKFSSEKIVFKVSFMIFIFYLALVAAFFFSINKD